MAFSAFGSASTAPAATGNAFGSFGAANNNNQQQQPASGGSLFGASQPATGGSLFGSASTAGTSTTGTGGGLFGSGTAAAQPAQTGGSLFGGGTTASTNTTGTTGGLFGSTSTTNTTGGTGLFGQTNPSASTGGGGGLFGQTTTATQPATGSLFGGTTTSQPATGGSLFGATSATPNQPATGSLFGNTSTNTAQPATGSLFGSTNNQQQAAGSSMFGGGQQTTSLFGSTAGTNNTGTGSNLFGSQNNNTGGGLFGSSTNNQPAQGGSLFGSTQAQQQPAQSALSQSALFGRPNATGMYASTLSVPPSLAASLGVLPNGGGLLKARGSVVPAPGAPADPAAQFAHLAARIEAIQKAWDARDPECRFQYAFYNLVDPAQVNLYGRPPNVTNEALWTKAVRENPDPTCLVPVIATGFDDLQQRVEGQTQTAAAHAQKLDELKQRLSALAERHALSNAPRQQRAAHAQAQIAHRLARLVSHLHLLIPALRASALRPEEEALRAVLDSLAAEIRGPGAGAHQMGRLRARLNELWTLLGAAQAARERTKGGAGDGQWAVVDEDGLREIAQILADQQAGLSHLTRLLQKDLRDLAIIEGTETRDEAGRVSTPVSALAASMGRTAMR